MPRCITKWEKVEALKPKDRRPVPPPPQSFDAMIQGAADGSYDIDTYNTEAFDHYNTMALVHCSCGRTFEPDSLIKHQKSCKSANVAAAQTSPNDSKTIAGIGSVDGQSLGATSTELVSKPPGALRP